MNAVAGAGELLRAGEARRPRADNRDLLAGADSGQLGLQALRDGAVGDRAFDRFDGDRVFVDVERAGGFARRRADAAGDFREVVGRVQVARGFVPVAVIDEVIPVGDLVVDRATRRAGAQRAAALAIGYAAIHAAGGLRLIVGVRQRQHEFAPMTNALLDRLVVAVFALVFEKASDLAHFVALFGRLHGLCFGLQLVESATILDRHDFTEFRIPGRPVAQDLGRDRRPGEVRVARNQQVKPRRIKLAHVGHDLDQAMRFEIARVMVDAGVDLLFGRHRLKLDHGRIAA